MRVMFVNTYFKCIIYLLIVLMRAAEGWPGIFSRWKPMMQELYPGESSDDDVVMRPSSNSDANLCLSCVHLDKCPFLKAQFYLHRRHHSDAQVNAMLQNLTCGYDGIVPRFCCDEFEAYIPDNSDIIYFEDNKIDSSLLPVRSNTLPHTDRLIPSESTCGHSFNNKVVGGRPADPQQFPWTTRLALELQRQDGTKAFNFPCGGALISTSHVLTAAHCVLSNRKLLFVRLGQIDEFTKNTQDIKPAKIKTHERYGANTGYKNDIALITLKEKAFINVYVIPICIPTGPEFLDNTIESGQGALLAGWGAMKSDGSISSPTLQWASQALISQSQCSEIYRQRTKYEIGQEQLCTKPEQQSAACRGDSGSPLFADKSGTIPSTLIGIVSLGPKKCSPNPLPTVYTSVAYYVKWIHHNMNS